MSRDRRERLINSVLVLGAIGLFLFYQYENHTLQIFAAMIAGIVHLFTGDPVK